MGCHCWSHVICLKWCLREKVRIAPISFLTFSRMHSTVFPSRACPMHSPHGLLYLLPGELSHFFLKAQLPQTSSVESFATLVIDHESVFPPLHLIGYSAIGYRVSLQNCYKETFSQGKPVLPSQEAEAGAKGSYRPLNSYRLNSRPD